MSNQRALIDNAVQLGVAEDLPGVAIAALPESDDVGTTETTKGHLPVRARVLEAACELFAAGGFHGTHLREICKRAGTNIAGVCYHFHSKEGLYEAVIMEAGRHLAADDGAFEASLNLPPEQRLQTLIESLMQKLSAKHAWVARILSRELLDSVGEIKSFAAYGLERDFLQLQAALRVCGLEAGSETVRLQALSVICDCVFYCLKMENRRHGFLSAACLPSPEGFARSITQRSLSSLNPGIAKREVSNHEPGRSDFSRQSTT